MSDIPGVTETLKTVSSDSDSETGGVSEGRKYIVHNQNFCPMKMLKTTLLLVCCIATFQSAQAQFQKGDWLLEGGFQTHLEGSFGKTDIDLSRGNFTYYDTDNFGLNVAAGKFFWEKREMGLVFEENWYRQTSEEYRISGNQSVLVRGKNYITTWWLGVYFRQYFDFGKGWWGGFLARAGGGSTWYAYYREENGIESGPYGLYTIEVGLRGNLFVAKTIGKHFGGRISFGNAGYSVSKRSAVEGILYSRFDFNLQTLITPHISIFWTFHGKSKNDRN